jgi:lambda repressor-like predicted transcriptional regulator
MEHAKSLAEWMTERGINLEQLLESTALDRKVLLAILNRRYTPSPQQRQRVAAALGVAPEEVLWGHTTPVEHIHGHGPQFGRSP